MTIIYLAKNAHETQMKVKYVIVLIGDMKRSTKFSGGEIYHMKPFVTLPFYQTPKNLTKIDLLNLE